LFRVFDAVWCLKFSSISITHSRQLISTNRYLLDITYYFKPIQSFNFPLSVGTFIAMVCRNHRGRNQSIKKQLNWRGCYSHETSNTDRVQLQSSMGQSFAGKDMQYLVVDSNFAHYRFLDSNYSNSPLCRSEILLHSYGFIQGQGKRYQGRSGYVGPISSLPLAKLQSSELKKRGLTKYTAIYKKSLIRDDSGKTVRTAKKAAPIAAATASIKRSQPSKTAPSVGKKPPTTQASQQRVEAAKKAPPTVSPTEERPPKPDAKISEKPSEEVSEFQRRGYGRNISAGKLSFSLRQTYREVNTELTERTQIESDGTTTNVPISSSEKNDFDTDMSLTMLRVGLGLTDFLEVYGEIGACYDDFEDFNLAYGGGARLNLFEVKTGSLRGFYTALEADYHKGKLETEYQSIAGNRFSKDADWWDFTGKGEIGFTRNRFASRRKIALVPTVASAFP
jgi:hypothetical protein